jgi:membrane protein
VGIFGEDKIMIKRFTNFMKHDIWRIRIRDIPRKQSFLIRNLRVILLALRGFDEDKCSLRASALTFYTLLSIVPVFAMAFGIAKGFGLERILEKQLLEKFPVQNEVIITIINFSHSLLDNTKGGVVAGVGVALLFWTVIKVLGNIEHSFNDIWGIKQMRSLGRRFTDYLSVMLICPVLLIAASSMTVFITSQAQIITQRIAFLGYFSFLIQWLLWLLPYSVMWVVFTFIYIFVPNTKVHFSSALLAGCLAGTIYQVVQWVYVDFQIGVAKFNAIYGSFAALPLFLVWLQLSWRIVLLGAELSFANQNVDTYEFEHDCLNVSHSFKNIMTLRIVNLAARNFSMGKKAFTAEDISQEVGIPIRLVRDILHELTETRILVPVKEEPQNVPAYQPGVDIHLLTIKYVLDKINSLGTDTIPVTKTKELDRIIESIQAFQALIEKSSHNALLKDL